ncbi:putative potassium channel [Venustampulla echinocandica]|uniref:Putative potassium channel n=1 Tax=Venustampulla echinocandica TaxID=2656787 RepID=A0A370TNI9_9HELO|nr:putative potassium channel [Venustampulla echinocandica]RDL37084.1 putative potassium channel [Venustampulla echinocandica]
MNDPGLDGPISKEAEDLEDRQHNEQDSAEEEEAYLTPSRWWFASTAFPLIAGTFGPMASTFSICSLVVHWRAYIPPGATEDDGIDINDPKWLTGINAAQLVIALISNLCLLLNMARRISFSVAQPITIIGWYLSSAALIGLCATASGPLIPEPRGEVVFTQAFYYAIIAAILYFLVASLMVANVWGAYRGHFERDFQLTISQRTLMLQTISFFVYLLTGSAVFSHVEGWRYLDTVYWSDYTLLTIGIGNIAPSTHIGRCLLFPYGIGGVIILGLVIGSIRSLVLERGKVKLGARMVEKERRRFLEIIEKKGKPVLQPITDEKPSMSQVSTNQQNHQSKELTERERRQQEFELMRKIQDTAHWKRRWTSLVISLTTWLILWFAGAAVFQASEKDQDWTYFKSLYFSYVSLLTIGYGDIYLESNSGKAFFVFWSLLAIPSLTILISNMGDTIVKGIRDLTLWIGNFTVLPGEEGVITTLKRSANNVTGGRIFDEANGPKETPPGILGETRRGSDANSEENHRRKNAPESAAQRAEAGNARQETARAQRRGEKQDKLPDNKHEYHCLLISEISQVMKHMNSSPPRKYTFDEWAWYLKVLGEDEESAETHRRAMVTPGPPSEGPKNATQGKMGVGMEAIKAQDGEEGKVEWSWVGYRSPLMGHKEEPEWVLERLTRRLERELESVKRDELERKGRERENEDNN